MWFSNTGSISLQPGAAKVFLVHHSLGPGRLVERRPGNVQLKLTDAQHQKLIGARRAMPEFIRQRTTHVIALWREGRWRKWLGLGWTVLSVFIVFRDDFWMPADTQKWRAINMIPRVSLKAWIIGTLILVVAFMFERSEEHTSELQS